MHVVCCMPVPFSGSLLTQVGSIPSPALPSQVQGWYEEFIHISLCLLLFRLLWVVCYSQGAAECVPSA